MATKKIKITVTKKKINIKRILILFFILLLIVLTVTYFIKLPLKNIYITGNNILSDKEIIEMSNLSDYPPYLKTYFLAIKENLLKNDYIKDVHIRRKIPRKIYIDIEEYKPIAIYKDKIILSSRNMVTNNKDSSYLPYVINDIDSIFNKFVDSFSKIDNDTLLKISHIEYAPNEVDKERFILYMVDSNYVHVTLTKIEKINKYNSIISELDGKKGIIYLDSGDYLEIKKDNQ